MYERTYKGVSLLQCNYFKLLCQMRGHIGGFDLEDEDPTGTHQPTQTFTVHISSRYAYDVMQKVFSDSNG